MVNCYHNLLHRAILSEIICEAKKKIGGHELDESCFGVYAESVVEGLPAMPVRLAKLYSCGKRETHSKIPSVKCARHTQEKELWETMKA